MKRILLHDQKYSIGGPVAVLDDIEKSFLSEHYEILRYEQDGVCGLNIFKAIKFIIRNKNRLASYNADGIYICGLQYSGFLLTVSARLAKIKNIVLSVHGSVWDEKNNSLRNSILKWIIEPAEVYMADSVFTVCEAAQKNIKALKFARAGCNKGIVYNTFKYPKIVLEKGKFRKEFSIENNKLVAVNVGRVVEDKGHPYLLQAVKANKDDNVVFVIVGDGSYLDTYRNMCKEEIESGKLILTGRRDDIDTILNDSDVFIFPTLHENHSIALLEAVGHRCAAIVTNVGGNPEIIEDKYSGLLIHPRDADAINSALNILSDKQFRENLANNAYYSCEEKFSSEKIYKKLDSILGDDK